MRKCRHGLKTSKECPDCKAIQSIVTKNYYKRKPWMRTLNSAKTRAKEDNLPFDLTAEFLKKLYDQNNGICPVLKIPITDNNPLSIDRIIPELGYIQSNVRLISWRANTLRNNATLSELRLILADAEQLYKEANTTLPL